MNSWEKAAVLVQVEALARHKRQTLAGLGVSRSTYYRWRHGQQSQDNMPHSEDRRRAWNRLTPEEDRKILMVARETPELSSRQLAASITDNAGFSVSEATVYRILRREGLVKRPEVKLVAGKEYHTRTTGPHQM